MRINNSSNGFASGRRGNIIYYTCGGKTYARRYAIPGKKRRWETEGHSDKQKEVMVRFRAVQVFYKEFAKQVSPIVWRSIAKSQGKKSSNLFMNRNFHHFGGEGRIIDFEGFLFTDGVLALPREIRVTVEEKCITITWQDERDWNTASRADLMQVGLLYDDFTLSPRLASGVKGCRGELRGEFTLEGLPGKRAAHAYIFFMDADGERFTPSYYTHVELGIQE